MNRQKTNELESLGAEIAINSLKTYYELKPDVFDAVFDKCGLVKASIVYRIASGSLEE